MEIQALETASSMITTIDQTSTLLCSAGRDRDSAIERKNYSRQLKLQKCSRFGGAGRNFFPIVANFNFKKGH